MNLTFNIKSLCRATALILLFAMLMCSLCSCGVIILKRPGDAATEGATTVAPESTASPDTEGADTSDDTEPPAVTRPPETTQKGEPVEFPDSRVDEAQERLDALPDDIDISDFKIVILSSKDTVNVIFSDEDSPLYASRSTRNTMLYDKYGVDVLTFSSDNGGSDTDTIYKDLSAAMRSGDEGIYLDLLYIPAYAAGRFLAGGLIKDMRLLPFYDAHEGEQSGNVGDSRYFDLGAGSDSPEYIYALYFNRTLFGKEIEKALYSAAFSGDLTFETLVGVSKTIEGRDADIGAVAGKELLGELAAPLLGISYITKDSSGIPKLAMSESERGSIDKLIETLKLFTFYTPAEGEAAPADKFTSGKLPFYLGTLGDMTVFYSSPAEWGILPLPSEKRLSAVSTSHPVVCVPAINSRLEQTSIWLTGFNAASGEWIRDQFLAVAIERYLRDNNSCLTLFDILSRKNVFGFERLFDGYYSGLADATYSAAGAAISGDKKFSDIYSSKISSVNKKLAKLP